jgi:hypothetical protein
MSILQAAVGLFISVLVAFAGITGAKAVLHAGHVTALEVFIGNVSVAANQYGNINESYAGLSCTSLASANLAPSPCNSSNSFTTPFNTSVFVSPSSTNAGYLITIQDSGSFTVGDFNNICQSLSSTATTCTPSYPSLTIHYGN